MKRSLSTTLRTMALLALALTGPWSAVPAHAQNDPCHSNDPADFDEAVRRTDCPPGPNMDPNAGDTPTILVTPHQADYSHFNKSSLTEFFSGLSDEEKARVVQVAARHGMTDGNDQPMSVEEFGSLTQFIDSEMSRRGYSDADKKQFLGQLAAEASVYQKDGSAADPTSGQDFGNGDGPRYDYERIDAPKK